MPGFPKGSSMSLINGERIVIDQMIGNGGTADIYRVLNFDRKCFECAKHLYHRYSADPRMYYEKYKILSRIPAPHPAFVWGRPDAMTGFDEATRSFVFVMELLDSSYKKVARIVKDPEMFRLRERLEICLVLAEAASAVTAQGLVFGDWSSNNVMWRTEKDGSISVRIIDSDGMSLPGYPLGLGGTGFYRSPEVMAGAEQTAQSDIHSLAVLTFRLFCGRHPLDGKRTGSVGLDEKAIMKYYCEEPIFIFDGDENAPSTLVKTRFRSLPEVLQLYYRLIFSNACLHGREDRPDADTLKAVLLKAKEEIMQR